MTADQIRKLPVLGIDTELDGKRVDDVRAALEVEKVTFLREIAAQLAEISLHLSDLCYKADFALRKRDHGQQANAAQPKVSP